MIVCKFFIFLLPVLSHSVSLCGGRGYRNATDGMCSCISGFHGANCEYKHCPFGKSWLSQPVANNSRHEPLVSCSNMGFCDIIEGKCDCRPGYEGRACERVSCPTSVIEGGVGSTQTSAITIGSSGTASVSATAATDLTRVPACSGRGVCRTMRELANGFDGRALLRAPMQYNNWEADRLQACVCDPGYEGADCSRRSCPHGRDPSHPQTRYAVEEVFRLQCRADNGFFSLLVLGRYTGPVPFDADPAYLKAAIEEATELAGEVRVEMQVQEDSRLPAACGAEHIATTKIYFDSYIGQRPPIFVTRNTSSTRRWPDGDTPLSSASGEAVLRMETRHVLHCPVCADCGGQVYFSYGDDVSAGIAITATGAASAVRQSLLDLPDLAQAGWTSLDVSVAVDGSGEDKICSTASETTTRISLYADYGNIPALGLVDGSYVASAGLPVNLTFASSAGNGTLYECSNQGNCNHDNGICECFSAAANGEIQYRTQSSDGRGGPGSRGDCGYIAKAVPSCLVAGRDACSGHGLCSNVTHTCECTDGWFGINCAVRHCPVGPAWADEPVTSGKAHSPAVCSGAGSCDLVTGLCACKKGYLGTACQIRDCDRHGPTGIPCSGHGVCLSTAEFFRQYGLSYGNASAGVVDQSATWDADSWYECVCSAKVSAGLLGDRRHPSVGPSSLISGVAAESVPLPGWSNWDCSLRNCPRGDGLRRQGGASGQLAAQRVVCTKDATANHSDYFLLGVFGQPSERIYTSYTAPNIKAALEHSALVGNVTVWFPNALADNITTACHATANSSEGGFLVQFDTELGPQPLMTDVLGAGVSVTSHREGTNDNLECGGPAMGFCDRNTGSCICNRHRYSSDGAGGPGSLGDCGYLSGTPLATDASTAFGYDKKDF